MTDVYTLIRAHYQQDTFKRNFPEPLEWHESNDWLEEYERARASRCVNPPPNPYSRNAEPQILALTHAEVEAIHEVKPKEKNVSQVLTEAIKTIQPVQTVSFYTMIAIEAARKNSRCGGGFRLYLLAKAIDINGLGMVKRDDLRAALLSLGVSPRNWQRWIIEARNHDMMTDVQKAGEWWMILHGPATIAAAMGLDTVGSKARMSAADLFSNGWRARMFAAWEDGKQISRQQIQKTLNVSRSTQKYRDNQAGVRRDRNYSKSALRADSLTGLQENTNHKAPFVLRDGFIAWRLPDTRYSTATEKAGKGRGRKINEKIHRLQQKGLSYMRRALTDGVRRDFVRLFNLTPAQLRQAERRASKQDSQVNDLYLRAETSKTGAILWSHCPRF